MQARLLPTAAKPRPRRVLRDITASCRAFPGWVALVLATVALSVAAAGDSVLPGDVAITRAVQSVALPGIGLLFGAVNVIGDTLGTCLVAATLAWWCLRRGYSAAALVVLGAISLRFANALIKQPIGSPRPTADLVDVTHVASGNGFPSAHVMGVVVLYGLVLLLAPELVPRRLPRLVAQALAGVMLLTIGLARIYAGAHWPTDVIGAYLYGALGLAGLLSLYRAIPVNGWPRLGVALRAASRRGAERITSALLPLVRRPTAQPVPVRAEARSEGERRRSR